MQSISDTREPLAVISGQSIQKDGLVAVQFDSAASWASGAWSASWGRVGIVLPKVTAYVVLRRAAFAIDGRRG
jgi:hypothetical protein